MGYSVSELYEKKAAKKRTDQREKLFDAAVESWRNWLVTFVVGGGAPNARAAILRQANAMEMRSTTPGVYSNPTLSHLLAEERAWWSAAASIDAIVAGMEPDQRQVMLGTALGYSQTEIGEAIGQRQQVVSEILGRAKEALVTRLLLTASVVRWINDEHGLGFAPPALSGLAGSRAV